MNDNKKNLQLINVTHINKVDGNDDKILIIFKDLDTGKKLYNIVETPEIEFYITKEEYTLDKHVDDIELDKVEKVKVPNKYLLKKISKLLGDDHEKFFNECVNSRKFYQLKNLHHDYNLHGSDVNISDQYIGKFLDQYPAPEILKLTKSYFDIEVDTYDYNGFPDEHSAPCPVISIAFYNESNNTMYVFITNNEENKSLVDFYNNQDKYKKELIKEVCEENNLENLNMEFFFYDLEIDTIYSFFNTVNELKPDINGSFNSRFDLLTLKGRIERNGYRSEEIMCPEELPYKKVFYYEDTRNQNFADRGDYFDITSYTYWIDQLLTYTSLRKTSGQKESYSLNAICEEELGTKKLEFDEDENIRTLPWTNFKKFIKYNIHDVILLKMLEDKTSDIDLMYGLSIMTRTRIYKAMKKTVCIRNLAEAFYKEQGSVMSNNHNSRYGDDTNFLNEDQRLKEEKTKFRGAFVSSPLNNDNVGMIINGKPSKYLFEKVIDIDLASLYPSIILALNIDASTQFGKLYIDNDDEEDNEIAYKFADSFVSNDVIAIAKKWFPFLPTPEEIMEEVNRE